MVTPQLVFVLSELFASRHAISGPVTPAFNELLLLPKLSGKVNDYP